MSQVISEAGWSGVMWWRPCRGCQTTVRAFARRCRRLDPDMFVLPTVRSNKYCIGRRGLPLPTATSISTLYRPQEERCRWPWSVAGADAG
jgi:hypothetical protein